MKIYVLVAAIILVSLLGTYYYVTSYVSSSTIEDPSSGYLSDLQGNETRIFLVLQAILDMVYAAGIIVQRVALRFMKETLASG